MIITEAYRELVKRKLYIPPLIDLFFIFIYGFISNAFLSKIAEFLYVIQLSNNGKLPFADSEQASMMILVLVILLSLFLFFTYIFLEGVAWWSTSKKRIPLSKFLKKFTKRSIILAVVFILLGSLRWLNNFFESLNIETDMFTIIVQVISLILFFFVFYLYSRISYNKKLNKNHVYSFVFLGLIFLINNMLPQNAFGLLIGIIAVLPSFTVFRIMLNNS